MTEELIMLIMRCAREVGEQEDVELPGDLNADTPLFGRRGVFDSLGLVSLVVAAEESIEDKYGVSISLADERAMSQSRSPFRTIGTLAEYASQLIGESNWETATKAR